MPGLTLLIAMSGRELASWLTCSFPTAVAEKGKVGENIAAARKAVLDVLVFAASEWSAVHVRHKIMPCMSQRLHGEIANG